MSPLELEIILWYGTRVADFQSGDIRADAPAVRHAIHRFTSELGLLQPTTDGDAPRYKLTERGQAFFEALTALPLPVQIWVMPPTQTFADKS